MSRRSAGLLALCLLAFASRPAGAQLRAGAPASVPVQSLNGVPYVSAGDLARLLDGTQFGRADLRKRVVRVQSHRLTFTIDVPIALIDDRTVRLDAPVRSFAGEVQIPVSFLGLLPRDSTSARLFYDVVAGRVRVAPPGGWIGAPRISVAGDVTTVTLAAERAAEAEITGRSRQHFRLRVPGTPGEQGRDSIPQGALVRPLRASGSGGSVELEFAVAPEAAGYRLAVAPGPAITLTFARSGSGLERFAAPSAPGPRLLRTVVIDPGHGGADTGVRAGETAEKDLALTLARVLGAELERRGVRVLLTRDDDRSPSLVERAEAANRAHADAVISLHFDGFAGSRAHGATVWCPPASEPEGGSGTRVASLTPWRDVALAHAAESRSLADALADALEQRGFGPRRVRERMPLALLGVQAPGVMVECATLTSPDDLARVTAPGGLRDLALAIAEGLGAYQRHDEP